VALLNAFGDEGRAFIQRNAVFYVLNGAAAAFAKLAAAMLFLRQKLVPITLPYT
jgi:hypothetical protein